MWGRVETGRREALLCGVLAVAVACDGGAVRHAEPERPDVVVYLIDALRPDRLGAYGARRPLSPRIDAFAREAVLFERAWAQSSWTKASVASIFTGVWPAEHGANRKPHALPAEALTLAEILRARGYWTAALSANPNVVEEFGFAQGFDLFRYFGRGHKRSTEQHRALAEVLDRAAGRPFFLYLHTVDPHAPYAPPAPFRDRLAPGIADPALGRSQTLFDLEAGRREATEELVADLSALYEAEVAANDASFGLLLDELARRDLLDSSVIVLVSDHGEELHDHGGWTHGKELYSESLAIPLVVRLPGGPAGLRVEAAVQQVDLLPTLLDRLGIEPPRGIEGRSLLPLLDGAAEPPGGRPIFSYLHLSGPPRAAVIDGSWKLIERYPPGRPTQRWLFDLHADPEERFNRADREPAVVERLSGLLARKLAQARSGEATEVAIDSELDRDLRALGYLQ